MSSRWRNEGGFQDREPGGSHHPQPEGGRRVLPEPRGGPEEARLVHVTRGARNRIETCWTAGARGHNGGRKRSLERPPPNPSEGSPSPAAAIVVLAGRDVSRMALNREGMAVRIRGPRPTGQKTVPNSQVDTSWQLTGVEGVKDWDLPCQRQRGPGGPGPNMSPPSITVLASRGTVCLGLSHLLSPLSLHPPSSGIRGSCAPNTVWAGRRAGLLPVGGTQ